ncbi:hypothetical protein SCYAM73S_03910 [Streptomyces cyaneofuscatus]
MLAAHPDLQLRNTAGVESRGSIDISKPAAAKLIDELLEEYTELFPGRFWHLGADEYQALTVRNPAASYPQLQRAAEERHGADATIEDLATSWLNDRADVVVPKGRTAKAWNDGLFRGTKVKADENIEIEYWTGKEIGARPPQEYLAEGYKMLNLNDEFLYYVLGEPGNEFVYPTGERIYEQWTPLVLRGTEPVAERYSRQILGGRFAVWGDLPNAQTTGQVANGIRMPLVATSQKLWDPWKPAPGAVPGTGEADRQRGLRAGASRGGNGCPSSAPTCEDAGRTARQPPGRSRRPRDPGEGRVRACAHIAFPGTSPCSVPVAV